MEQLELPGGLNPERLTDAGLKLLPALLAAELVPDAAETYARVGDYPFAFREEYFAASKGLASYVCELPGGQGAILSRWSCWSSSAKPERRPSTS